MTSRRQRQVASLIHRELSQILLFESKDPRVHDITITDVEVTADLQLARVYFSVIGGEEQVQEALDGLAHAKGYLRSQLAGRVELRLTPDLSFEVDRTAAYAQRIEELLERIAQNDNQDARSES